MASLRRPASPSPQATPIPEVTIDGVATTPDAAVSVDIPDNAADEYQKETIRADDATAVLKRQIEALEQSERLQRQHAERQQQHTHAINQLAEHASRTAAEQGHQPGSAEHLNRAREIFHNYLQSQAQAAANPAPVAQPISRPLAPLPQEAPEQTSHYSAPVSRGEIGGYREPTLASVRLSADEKAIAAASGISETTYAKHKLELLRRHRAGEIQK